MCDDVRGKVWGNRYNSWKTRSARRFEVLGGRRILGNFWEFLGRLLGKPLRRTFSNVLRTIVITQRTHHHTPRPCLVFH